MIKYDCTALEAEERFDDLDYAEYEMADYSDAGLEIPGWEDENNEISGKNSDKRNGESKELSDYDDLYTRNVKIEDEETLKALFTRLRNAVLYGTKQERDEANEEACLYLKGLVIKCINQRYKNYIQRDPDYRKELMNEAFLNIIKYLPKYDPEKGQPSTFFYFYIQSALATMTTRVKHHMSSSDSALKRKIYALREEFKKAGLQLNVADIMIETGETRSKIQSVMKMMSYDTNTHLEAMEEYDQLIAGDPDFNQSYESPEKAAIRRVIAEGIVQRAKELFGEDTVHIYFRNVLDGEAVRDIAKSFGVNDDKIRRTIEMVQHGLEHDWKIRRLGSGYIRDDEDADPYALPILPAKGQIENMELLEMTML